MYKTLSFNNSSGYVQLTKYTYQCMKNTLSKILMYFADSKTGLVDSHTELETAF